MLSLSKYFFGGTLAKQTADLRSVEKMLLRAREIAEELSEVVVAYFIDMAIAETRTKNPPLANDDKPLSADNQEIQKRKEIR